MLNSKYSIDYSNFTQKQRDVITVAVLKCTQQIQKCADFAII